MGIPGVLGQLTLWLLSNSHLEMLGSLVLSCEGGMLPQVQKNPGPAASEVQIEFLGPRRC